MTRGRTKTLVLALLAISLLVVGVFAMAHGLGRGETADWHCSGPIEDCPYGAERDADGDGIVNCADEDWSRPLAGSGYGQSAEYGLRNGSGYGPRGLCWQN
ncbi:MAG TPA: hypothetical protein VMX15_05445 [Candidatus Heimdallarchaeota archaeon]|nr:hypothetical protein [Candidatus Heimdallarchaeota archaeon]